MKKEPFFLQRVSASQKKLSVTKNISYFALRPTGELELGTTHSDGLGGQEAGGGRVIEGGEIVGGTAYWGNTRTPTGTLGDCPG